MCPFTGMFGGSSGGGGGPCGLGGEAMWGSCGGLGGVPTWNLSACPLSVLFCSSKFGIHWPCICCVSLVSSM